MYASVLTWLIQYLFCLVVHAIRTQLASGISGDWNDRSLDGAHHLLTDGQGDGSSYNSGQKSELDRLLEEEENAPSKKSKSKKKKERKAKAKARK